MTTARDDPAPGASRMHRSGLTWTLLAAGTVAAVAAAGLHEATGFGGRSASWLLDVHPVVQQLAPPLLAAGLLGLVLVRGSRDRHRGNQQHAAAAPTFRWGPRQLAWALTVLGVAGAAATAAINAGSTDEGLGGFAVVHVLGPVYGSAVTAGLLGLVLVGVGPSPPSGDGGALPARARWPPASRLVPVLLTVGVVVAAVAGAVAPPPGAPGHSGLYLTVLGLAWSLLTAGLIAFVVVRHSRRRQPAGRRPEVPGPRGIRAGPALGLAVGGGLAVAVSLASQQVAGVAAGLLEIVRGLAGPLLIAGLLALVVVALRRPVRTPGADRRPTAEPERGGLSPLGWSLVIAGAGLLLLTARQALVGAARLPQLATVLAQALWRPLVTAGLIGAVLVTDDGPPPCRR